MNVGVVCGVRCVGVWCVGVRCAVRGRVGVGVCMRVWARAGVWVLVFCFFFFKNIFGIFGRGIFCFSLYFLSFSSYFLGFSL